MSLLLRLIIFCTPVALISIVLASFYHSPTTVLIVADTDVVSFDPTPGTAFPVEGVIGPVCQASQGTAPTTFQGHIEASSANVRIARLAAKTLNILVTPKEGASVALVDENGHTAVFPCAVSVFVPPGFFTSGAAIFSVAARTPNLVIGGTGLTSDDVRGATLVSGTATTMTRTLLSDGIVRGTPVPLALGDIVRFSRADGTGKADATVFARVESDGTIEVTAHLPVETLGTSSVGSSGTTVWVSWWQRMTAEPTLILLGALFGGVLAIPGTWKSVRTVLALLLRSGRRKTTPTPEKEAMG